MLFYFLLQFLDSSCLFSTKCCSGFRCDIVHRKTISLLLLLLPAVALACRFCRLFLFVCVTKL